MDSSLHRPDDPDLRSELGYSQFIAQSLTSIYAGLKRGGTQPEALPAAFGEAKRIAQLQMSARQRLLTFHALGLLLIGSGDLDEGLGFVVDALDIAKYLGDRGARVELTYLAGVAERAGSHYESAAEFLTESLGEMQALAIEGRSVDPQLEASSHILLGACRYVLEDLESALVQLAEAEFLLPAIAQPQMQQANIDWMRAVILRSQGAPREALPLLHRAADVYEQLESPAARMTYARLQVLVAEIALDLAENPSPGGGEPGREAMLALADPYVTRAVALADPTRDPAGEILALHARVRFDRASGRPADIVRALEIALSRSRQLHDIPLLAQTYTAMGDAFAQRGERESSLACYRKALDVVGSSDAQVMAARARKALIRASRER